MLNLSLSLCLPITYRALYLVYSSKVDLMERTGRAGRRLTSLGTSSFGITLKFSRCNSLLVSSRMGIEISKLLARRSDESIISFARVWSSFGGAKLCRRFSRSQRMEWEISYGDRYGLTWTTVNGFCASFAAFFTKNSFFSWSTKATRS